MRVTHLELFDYRNYTRLDFTPGAGLNVLVGPNAQGKTNLLEAIYVLATTKSHRTRKDTDLVRFGAEACRVVASVESQTRGETILEIAIASGRVKTLAERKLVKVNHGKQPRMMDLLGHLNAVLFASTDLDIVRGEPDERRRFLNYEIAQVSPRYVVALAQYKKTLEQRNRLLKDAKYGRVDSASLVAWDGLLIEHGSRLMERRSSYLETLSQHASALHQSLTDGNEFLSLAYDPAFSVKDAKGLEEISRRFEIALERVQDEERHRGTTMTGPQRDDMTFRLGPNELSLVEARTFGSQGQQRTAALSLRLAEQRVLEESTGETPIVLLDDVLSDLDEKRRAQIFALALSGGQVFLTTTDLEALPNTVLEHASIWGIKNATLEQIGEKIR
jgi:DNA replication and repair protein RecF